MEVYIYILINSIYFKLYNELRLIIPILNINIENSEVI